MPDLEPLPPDVRAMLDRVKPIDELDAARKAGLFDRLAERLVLPPLAPAPDPPPPDPPPPAPPTAVSAAGRAVLIAVTSLGVGVGAGIALDRTVLAPPVAPMASSVVTAPSAPPPVAPAFTATAFVSSLPAVPHAASPPVVAPKESAPRPADPARGLAAERALLDVARTALSRGDGADAREAVARHEREFPDGILVEEREAIAVKALVALGRRDEARARASEFRRRFPNSVNLHAVNAAVGAEP